MPYHDVYPEALEFEVLVARGARRGVLDLAALMEPFAHLVARYGQTMADPRRLDMTALVAALQALPHALATVATVEVVADLAAFGLSPLQADAAWPAAQADADTLLIACPAGLAGLQGLAVALCTVMQEGGKWRRLLQDQAPLQHALQAGDVAALPAAALFLGQDVHALAGALTATGGSLWAHLARRTPPHVRVHAALQPHLHATAARRRVQRIVTALAESGLGHRPLHLWLGPATLLEPASPYCRELGAPLAAWGVSSGLLPAPPAGSPPGSGPTTEDWAYAAVATFLQADPRLAAERAAVDRTCGIWRLHADDGPVDLVDTGRLDPSLWDSRLPDALPAQAAAAVVMRLDSADATTPGVVPGLLAALGPRLQSVVVVSAGRSLHDSAAIEVPARLHPWRGGMACRLGLHPLALATAAVQAQGATVRSVPAYIDAPFAPGGAPEAWLGADAVDAAGHTFGQWAILAALEAHQHDMGPATAPPMAWFVVPTDADAAAQPVPWACNLAAIARAALLQCMAAPVAAPTAPLTAPPAPTAPGEAARSPSRRGVRIRA